MTRQYVYYRAAKTLNCSVFEVIDREIDGDYGNWVAWAMVCERVDQIVENALNGTGDSDEDDE